jgi:crotonobetaine/carnitine-CoA ligase
VRHPLGAVDFSSFLLSLQETGANVIGLANAGSDAVNAIKWTREFRHHAKAARAGASHERKTMNDLTFKNLFPAGHGGTVSSQTLEPYLDPRMGPLDEIVLRDALERQARERPDKLFAIFEDGTSWTYRETLDSALRTANALRRLGVQQGDKVLSWLPNGKDALRVWFGLNCLGAVVVPINIAYRGRLLEHVVHNAEAKLIVAHAELADRLNDIDRAVLATAIIVGGSASPQGLEVLPAAALDCDDATPPVLARPIAPWDTQSIIYTSGTTGPSKGVLSSYFHLRSMGIALPELTENDRFLINLPLFHVGGTMPITAMLLRGGSIVVVRGFETERFWSIVREENITATILLGAMVGFLHKRPPAAEDRGHPLRWATIAPYNDAAVSFGTRFGCDVYCHFNMSEVSVALRSGANPPIIGSCGLPREGVTTRVVDENDCEVPQGTDGELVLRTDCPWEMSHGYFRNPEATALAWRNGWFHTGDSFRVESDGCFTFVDRIKDAIRRRGENISSAEVEAEVMAHSLVKEAAAVAVPSEHGEDEVLVAVVLVESAVLDPADLIHFLVPRMPHYMVPRYVRIVEELPRTPTHKVLKHVLRAMDISAEVWDREKANIPVKATRIGSGGR